MERAKKTTIVIMAGLAVAVAVGAAVLLTQGKPGPRQAYSSEAPRPVVKPKVLFVDSYHKGYPWSEGIIDGVLNTLHVTQTADGRLDDRRSDVELRIVRMDTKRNTSEDFKLRAGQRVKAVIDSWKPDVVICADDNASKYVIVPYYRDTDTPFIFCGVNWDASAYGFPCDNVTGMVEVSLIPSLLETMQKYARGPRVGLLGARNKSNMKEAEAYVSKFKLDLAEIVFVDNFDEWRTAYLDLQTKLDMLIVAPPSFLMDSAAAAAGEAEARQFVLDNTKIQTGSVEDWIAPYSLVCFAKKASEQGEWAAQTAMKILAGTSPRDIPVVTNHDASVYLNMALAKRLGIRFPIDLVEQATIVSDQ